MEDCGPRLKSAVDRSQIGQGHRLKQVPVDVKRNVFRQSVVATLAKYLSPNQSQESGNCIAMSWLCWAGQIKAS
jgi:hypothetical protein